MSELHSSMEQLASRMLKQEIVKFGGPFVLKDGRKSVAYVNLREMISLPGIFDDGVRAYADTIRHDPDIAIKPSGERRYLAGIPEAGLYYAGAVAYEIGGQLPLLQRRVKLKSHGQPRAIEGRFAAGDEVVLLDDVITSAKAKLAEANILEQAGLKTTGVIVLVDREQGGAEELKTHNIDLVSAMTLSGIAKYALDQKKGQITQTIYDSFMEELDS
ncbi:hypothetical protein KW801_02970 [Candidatus Saccharibacteria bacterium]|nr:hypothetical protein [Candidatus Saccharibacteria bacterium]